MTREQLAQALYLIHECTITEVWTGGAHALEVIATRLTLPQELARKLVGELVKLKCVEVSHSGAAIRPIVGILP